MTLTASFLQLGHSIGLFKHYEFTPTSLVPKSFLTSNHMEYIWNHISNHISNHLKSLPYHCDLPTILMILEILSLSAWPKVSKFVAECSARTLKHSAFQVPGK